MKIIHQIGIVVAAAFFALSHNAAWGGNQVYVIVNPVAGNGKCEDLWTRAETIIQQTVDENDLHIYMTEHEAHADVQAREIFSGKDPREIFHPENPPLFLAVGGDGTFGQVSNVLREKAEGLSDKKEKDPQYYIGILPFGSGNSAALGVGMPMGQSRDDLEHQIKIVLGENFINLGAYKIEQQTIDIPDSNSDAGSPLTADSDETKTRYAFMEWDIGITQKAGQLQKEPGCCTPCWNCYSEQCQYTIAGARAALSSPPIVVNIEKDGQYWVPSLNQGNLTASPSYCTLLAQALSRLCCGSGQNSEKRSSHDLFLSFAAATTTGYFAGNYLVNPGVRSNKDQGQIVLAGDFRRFARPLHMSKIREGTHLQLERCTDISLTDGEAIILHHAQGEKPIPIQIDGEQTDIVSPMKITWNAGIHHVKSSKGAVNQSKH